LVPGDSVLNESPEQSVIGMYVGEFRPALPTTMILGSDPPGLSNKEEVKQAIWRMKPKALGMAAITVGVFRRA